jgi:RNA polymerase sigma factor (sigma-70 family)
MAKKRCTDYRKKDRCGAIKKGAVCLKLNNEQRRKAEENVKLAYSRANYWKVLNMDHSEILSTAMYGLVLAVKKFDKTKGVSFSTFCYRVIDNEVLKLVRYQRAEKRNAVTVSLNQQTNDSQEFGEMLGEEETFPAENQSLIQFLSRGLTSEERLLIDLYFYKNLNQADIGNIFGVSQVHVSRMIRKALDKMRENREEGHEIS